MRRTTVLTTLVLASALALSACGGKSPDAVTVPTGADATAGTGSSAPAPAASTDTPTPEPAVVVLTKAQATAALPTAADIGKGFKKTKSSTPSANSGKDKVSPASCQAIFAALNTDALGKAAVKVERDYEQSTWGPFLGIEIESYKAFPPENAFEPLATALGKCPKFTSTDAKGVKTSYVIKPLKFPNLGDQTLAFTLNAKQKGFPFIAEFAVALKGNNAAYVTYASIGNELSPGVTERATTETLANLP